MKKLALGIVFAGLLGGCASRQATAPQPQAPAISPSAAAAATNYVQMALSTDQFEIQSSQIALQSAQTPAVRDFAQSGINEHAQLSNQLNASAQAAAIAAPQVVMLPQHSGQLTQLQYARGPEFDNLYRNAQVAVLMQALVAHQQYAATGEVPALRAFASNAVPVIQARLSQAQSMSIVPPNYRPPSHRRSGERG